MRLLVYILFCPFANPTNQPSFSPTTVLPTRNPTHLPSHHPTPLPTLPPTFVPTATPTLQPTQTPTLEPTNAPTQAPTSQPTITPTQMPTLQPTLLPTVQPTHQPTAQPTFSPTTSPTSKFPTSSPTRHPTTSHPTQAPTQTAFSWSQTFGVLFAFLSLCGPLPPNALQWVATTRRWRLPSRSQDFAISYAFHRHATLCCLVLSIRWGLEVIFLTGIGETVGYILMNFAIYIMELWIFYASYHALRTAYAVSLAPFSRRTTEKVFLFMSLQWWIASLFAYGLGIVENNEIFDVISHGGHALSFVSLFILLMYHNQRLHARLGGRDIMVAKKAKENMSRHLRDMYLICCASLIAAAISTFYLFNRIFGNGRKCVVCSIPMTQSEMWTHFIGESCMFLGLIVGTWIHWVSLRPRVEREGMHQSLLSPNDVTFDISASQSRGESSDRMSTSISRGNQPHSLGSPVSVSVKMARSPPDELE